jgi:hypothetical protein
MNRHRVDLLFRDHGAFCVCAGIWVEEPKGHRSLFRGIHRPGGKEVACENTTELSVPSELGSGRCWITVQETILQNRLPRQMRYEEFRVGAFCYFAVGAFMK